jgi:acetyltransferase-like isoleucine patch superfamily enzyme
MLTTSSLIYNYIFDELSKVVNKVGNIECYKKIIGNDIWIGSSAKIKIGLTIGDVENIDVSSLVSKNIAPHSNVVALPLKSLKCFPPKMITLLKSGLVVIKLYRLSVSVG